MIQQLRELRNWTQQHLAEAAGLSLRTVQRVEGGETGSRETMMALAAAFGVDTVHGDDGPHVVLTPDSPPVLPGCVVTVFKDGWRVPCVTRLDSRARTVTRHGMLLLDFTLDEFESRVTFAGEVPRPFTTPEGEEPAEYAEDGCFIIRGRHYWYPPTGILVDGEPWDGREHPRTFHYDAVLVRGPYACLYDLRETGEPVLPRHWVKVPTDSASAAS